MGPPVRWVIGRRNGLGRAYGGESFLVNGPRREREMGHIVVLPFIIFQGISDDFSLLFVLKFSANVWSVVPFFSFVKSHHTTHGETCMKHKFYVIL